MATDESGQRVFEGDGFERVPTEAHARRGDPSTSVEAAKSLDPTSLRTNQRAIVSVFLHPSTRDEMTDQRIALAYRRLAEHLQLPTQRGSGLRTRRSELVKGGLIEDTGARVRLPDSNRRAIVWRLTTRAKAETGRAAVPPSIEVRAVRAKR